MPSFARFRGKLISFGNLRADGLSSVRYVLDTMHNVPVSLHTLLKLRL